MSDVSVKRVRKVNHVDGCKKLRTCPCPSNLVEGAWKYDIRFRWPSGKDFREKKRVPLPGPKLSESRALAWAQERYRSIIAAGEVKEVKGIIPTVSEFKETYIRHKKNQRLKASTEYQRESVIRNWILPTLGDYRLDEIDYEGIDLLKEEMAEKSTKYVNNVLGYLSNMVRTAKKLKVIDAMPVETFELFKIDNSKPPPFYTDEELGRLVEAAMKLDLRIGTVVLLGGDAGLRAGEIRALAPYDVKWDQRQLQIERQVWHDVVDSPKSGKGRMVPMTDRLAWAIRKLGRVKGDTLLVDADGTRFEAKRMRSLVKQAQFNAGLEATGNVHILRHTFCTRLAMERVAPTVIQALAGHKHLTTTMRYMHVVPGVTAEAIKTLDRPLPKGMAPEEDPGSDSGFWSYFGRGL